MTDRIQYPKCGSFSGDRWAQCEGLCPMPMSPHYAGPAARWDARFIALARHIAGWSKDPGTQVGAVIVRPDKTLASAGYNGFPRGVDDQPHLLTNRDEKLKRVVHAEMNAILEAREPVRGYTLYLWPMLPCERCAVHVIQAGITRVVAPKSDNPRWDFTLTRQLFTEAGVSFLEVQA